MGRRLMYKPERLAQRQQAAFRALAERHGVPLGSADGAQQDGVRAFARRERLCGEGFARRVDGASAERELRELERVAEFRGALFQHAHGDPHDFWADAVARQTQQFSFAWSWFYRGPIRKVSPSNFPARTK